MDDTVDDAHINGIHPFLGKLFFCPQVVLVLLRYVIFYNVICIISIMFV